MLLYVFSSCSRSHSRAPCTWKLDLLSVEASCHCGQSGSLSGSTASTASGIRFEHRHTPCECLGPLQSADRERVHERSWRPCPGVVAGTTPPDPSPSWRGNFPGGRGSGWRGRRETEGRRQGEGRRQTEGRRQPATRRPGKSGRELTGRYRQTWLTLTHERHERSSIHLLHLRTWPRWCRETDTPTRPGGIPVSVASAALRLPGMDWQPRIPPLHDRALIEIRTP